LRCFNGLNFDSSAPETKNFVDSLFKTLKSQVYDVPVTPTTTTVPHTALAITDALAKYMLAIVNKDKSVAELRASVVEQLDVFLHRSMFIYVCTTLLMLLSTVFVHKMHFVQTVSSTVDSWV
jgi:3-dehydroquinate dehydratase